MRLRSRNLKQNIVQDFAYYYIMGREGIARYLCKVLLYNKIPGREGQFLILEVVFNNAEVGFGY